MLQKIGFLPGFNKQITPTGAEAQWTGGENVRFRYGTPEKVGGWQSLGDKKLTGPTRALHHLVNKDGIKYAILGTNRILYVYSGGVFYDIHLWLIHQVQLYLIVLVQLMEMQKYHTFGSDHSFSKETLFFWWNFNF